MKAIQILQANIWLLELAGTAFMLLGVWLTTKQNKWSWWVSIVGLLIYIFIFFQAKLYADATLQTVYIGFSLYGWYQWQNSSAVNLLKVTKATIQQHIVFMAFGIIAGFLIYYLLKQHTDSDMPVLDAFTTSFSLIATYMMAKKILHCWWYWIVIDLVYTMMYFYKFLNITAFQYLIFTSLAVYGYLQWRKELEKI